MEFKTFKGVDRARLTVDEEVSLAQCTLDILSNRWVQGDLHDFFHNQVWWKKSAYGDDIKSIDLDRYVSLCDRYDFTVPNLSIGSGSIYDSCAHYKEAKTIIVQVWREVWERHERFQSVADEYKVFPRDIAFPPEIEEDKEFDLLQQNIENQFWQEVRRMKSKLNCSEKEAKAVVSDYMPRGHGYF